MVRFYQVISHAWRDILRATWTKASACKIARLPWHLTRYLNKSFRVLSSVKQSYRDIHYFAYKICAYSCHSRVICHALCAVSSHACPCHHLFTCFPVEGHIFTNSNTIVMQLRTPTEKNGTRNITWYNPQWNSNIKSNIGKKFLNIVNKSFPKQHPLHKIFNRQTLKISTHACQT